MISIKQANRFIKSTVYMMLIVWMLTLGVTVKVAVTMQGSRQVAITDVPKKIACIEEPAARFEEIKERQIAYVPSRARVEYGVIDTDLRRRSLMTADEINLVLKETSLQGLGGAYVKAEEDYGVNALFLLALSIHESYRGQSYLAQTKNNLYGFGAYDDNPNLAVRFSSKEECIYTVAKVLSRDYLTADGKYFNGYTLRDINIRYASDKRWSSKVANLMVELDRSIREGRI